MEKHLHIICLNVPYPVDYGGVFDLYYKLPALQQQGVRIHLHCFEYGRGKQPVLEQYCEEVLYYPRKKGLSGFSFSYPYIVSSRRSNALRERLLKDDYPILMEGVHCSYLLNDEAFKHRMCFIRLHNVEHVYYKHLASYSSSFLKRLYYQFESALLLNYEKRIADSAQFFSVSENDVKVYQAMGAKRISYVPLFLPAWEVSSKQGRGEYCIYHGDLSTAENEKAVDWLVKEVFNDLTIPLMVAGKNPSTLLRSLSQGSNNVKLISNPTEEEMQRLIADAQINIVPSFNATGIKLKLINALYNGRHCIANKAAVEGTGLDALCHVVDEPREMKAMIRMLMNKMFDDAETERRRSVLGSVFDSRASAKQMIDVIWDQSS